LPDAMDSSLAHILDCQWHRRNDRLLLCDFHGRSPATWKSPMDVSGTPLRFSFRDTRCCAALATCFAEASPNRSLIGSRRLVD
jgi:hypothetical protein